MYTVAMIGAGAISVNHLAAVAQHPDTQLIAVADLDLERAQQAAAPFGAASYSDYREMLRRETPALVIVSLPHALHEECVLACAEAGAHILLEKPMSTSYESCLRMEKICSEAGVLLQVGHVQRYIPENRAAKALMEDGKLGQLAMVADLRTTNYFQPDRPRWFLSKRMAGGGISMNYAAHSLDKLCYLTGSSISAITGSCTYLQEGVEVDGSAQMLVTMSNGVSASISLCGYPVVPLNETMLYFAHGAIRLHTGTDLFVTYGGEYVRVDTGMYPDAFFAQWSDFVEGVCGGRILRCDSAYGAAIIRAIEHLY